MVQEAYVSFETARLLKEKGFQQKEDNSGYHTTEMVYGINADEEGNHHFAHRYPAGVYNFDGYICAPTLQMATRWLREVHHVHVEVSYYWNEGHYYFSLISTRDGDGKNRYFSQSYDTYEDAVEAGITICLKFYL